VEYRVGESTVIFSEFFRVEKALVAWERWDGRMGEEVARYVVRRGDSVGILPVCDDGGEVVLVRQFRYPACGKGSDGYLWEIPAGMLDGEEDREQAARRELIEEIGLAPENMQYLLSFFLSPGAFDEKFHLFFASIPKGSSMGRVGGNPHEQEDLLIGKFEKEKLLMMIKTIASILFYFTGGR
jgi:ADP-ribose pyrophosphatase